LARAVKKKVATPVQNGKTMDDLDSEWQCKGATLSDKTARKEFGLTQNEIVEAIRTGKLQYRRNSIHGNPFLRLLRGEVEAVVRKKYGEDHLKNQQAKTELARINRELKRLKTQLAILEERKAALTAR
jgi:hypothetical protein